ncbi:APC family permease [Mycolicibacterium mucogenicum]|uniref:APC family permease n=1 Tax=Mycolicibacterium mucogenicum TaxID=56689 RepID=UPI0006B351FC|nr:APC family permease [Mycolicibacterium mucogenicum]
MSAPNRVELAGRALASAQGHGLQKDALGFWGVFAQGLAAAAPSVALASVPFSLFVAAGSGATWAVLVGLTITVLIATTISFQARRTVSSGSLGTYTGNGLGPGFAYTAGFSLLIGYIGFATTGTLGGVVYLDSFLESIGLGSQATWFRLLLVVVIVGVATYLPFRGASIAAKYELVFELIAIASILVIIVASYVGYGFRVDWEQWNPAHLGSSTTFIAAVSAVGSYAGFESVASLGAEAKDAHRNIARSLLRVVLLLGVLYVVSTYPQILHFNSIDGDKAILPQLADSTGVHNWGFLISYLLVVVATPIWLYKIRALTPVRLAVSVAATLAIGYVIFSNFYPAPKFPFNILPLIYAGILLAGLAWYWYLKRAKPEVARRIGSIQTLSETEQQRLIDEGILEVLDHRAEQSNADEDREPDRDKEPVAP